MKTDKKTTETKASSFTLANWKMKVIIETWLNTPLHSEKAIARNRVVKMMTEKFEDFEKDRLALVEQHGKRDEDKNLIIKDGSYVMIDEEAFQKEWALLKDTEAIFDILPSTRPYWKTVRDIIKDSKVEMDIEATDIYEELLEKLKQI